MLAGMVHFLLTHCPMLLLQDESPGVVAERGILAQGLEFAGGFKRPPFQQHVHALSVDLLRVLAGHERNRRLQTFVRG